MTETVYKHASYVKVNPHLPTERLHVEFTATQSADASTDLFDAADWMV